MADKKPIVTKESLEEMISRRQAKDPNVTKAYYTSGREIKVGDTMNFGLLYPKSDAILKKWTPETLVPKEKEETITTIEMISYHSEEIGTLYELRKDQSEGSAFLKLQKI